MVKPWEKWSSFWTYHKKNYSGTSLVRSSLIVASHVLFVSKSTVWLMNANMHTSVDPHNECVMSRLCCCLSNNEIYFRLNNIVDFIILRRSKLWYIEHKIWNMEIWSNTWRISLLYGNISSIWIDLMSIFLRPK